MDERVNQTALDIVHIHNYRSLLKYWISEASHVVMPLFRSLTASCPYGRFPAPAGRSDRGQSPRRASVDLRGASANTGK